MADIVCVQHDSQYHKGLMRTVNDPNRGMLRSTDDAVVGHTHIKLNLSHREGMQMQVHGV